MGASSDLLEIALEALAKHKISIKELKEDIDKLDTNIVTHANTLEINKKDIDEKFIVFDNKLIDTIRKEISKIPIPKDGKDGKDGQSFVGKDGKQGKEGKQGPQGKIGPKGDQGPQGLPGKQGETGKAGKAGKSGKDGKVGSAGKDGLGIKNIRSNATNLIIELTDGSERIIALPKIRTNNGGGFTAGTASPGKLDHLVNVNIDNAVEGEVLTYNSATNTWIAQQPSGGTSDTIFKNRTELEGMFNSAYTTAYSELIYTNGNITQINVFENDTKIKQLFTKDITYTNGSISQVLITNTISTQTLTKDIYYDTNGNITEIKVS